MKRKLHISQMSCSHCESKIKSALKSIGIDEVDVDLNKKVVLFESDKSNEDIIEIIEEYGFDIDNIE